MHPRNDDEHARRTDRAPGGAGRAGLLGMAGAALAVAGALVLGPRCDAPEREPRGRATSPAAGAGDDGAVMLAWSVAHPHWGTEAVLVRRDGRARYLLDPPNGGGPPVRAEVTLPPDDVAELERRLVAARPCELASTRRAGRPHESRPTLEVAIPGARCAVTLWFDEWRESERARASAEVVAELRSALRRGPEE
jgi:hypothetical protein